MSEHGDLRESLAEHLRVGSERKIAWTEVTLPCGSRPDVFSIRPRGARPDAAILEVKASRSDFWSDVNEGKFRKYEPWCHRGYFATPAGLVRRDEVPEGWGLITWREKGWRVVKPATPRSIAWDAGFLVSLLDRSWFEDARSFRALGDVLRAGENRELRVPAWKLGRGVAERLWRLEALEASGAMAPEAREAVNFTEKVLEAARLAGLTSRFGDDLSVDDLARLVPFAVEILKQASTVRDIGRFLSTLPTATAAPALPSP